MLPEDSTSEWRKGLGSITDEAADSVSVKSKEKRDEQVVCVPEGFERLLANAVVGGSIHQQHAKKHDMACDTTSLGIVDLNSGDGSNLRLLHVIEAIVY